MYHDMGYPAHSYATNYLTTPYSAEMMNSNVFGGGGSMVNGDVGDSFSPASPSSQYFLYGGLDGRKIDFGKMNESTTLSPLNPMMTMAPINNTNNNNNSPLPFNGRDATTTMLHHVIHPMAMTQTLVTENRGTWYQPPIGTGSQSDTSSNGREARNRAEKNRRDKLNKSIQELAGRVRNVAGSSKRIDKTGILRFSAHGLRIEYVFGNAHSPCQFSINHSTTESLMSLVNGFLIAVTCRGNIVIITSSIEQHLGHCQTDLLGQNLLNYTHPDDQAFLREQLIPKNVQKLFDNQLEDENGEPRARTEDEEKEIDRKLREDKRFFSIRLARAGPRSEPTTYDTISFNGSFRRADSAPRGMRNANHPSGLQMLRRARCGRDDSLPLPSIGGNDVILIAMGHIIKPPVIYDRLIEASKFEYKTRHLIDGRIVQCDQRISLVAGYMEDEVRNLSPFTFMHRDDVRWVMVALRQMYDTSSPYGESCYRLMARTGQFIYLRTRGYLDIDRETNQVCSFVCVNMLVDEDEGKQLIREMKRKFTIMIQETEIATDEPDVPAVENPAQLERAIMSLITNLHHTGSTNDPIASPETECSSDDHESDTNRSVKSPPLEIIAPKPSTIKTSIERSMGVVSSTIKYIPDDETCDDDNKNAIKQLSSKSGTKSTATATVVRIQQQQQQKHQPIISSQRNNTQKHINSTSTATISSTAVTSTNTTNNKSMVTSSSIYETVRTIKQEQPDSYEDVRVPPLPTNLGYFDKSPFNSQQSFNDDVPSPVDKKPFDFHGFDPLQVQQVDQSRFLTSKTATQYQQFDTGDLNNSITNQIPSSSGGVKRGCSPDMMNSANKRRTYSLTSQQQQQQQTNNKRMNNGTECTDSDNNLSECGDGFNERLPLVMHQTCINQLVDPNLDLVRALPTTFDALDESLNKIHETATELRDQGTTYSNQQLNEILEEEKEQSQILDNLRHRLEICRQNVPENMNINDRPILENIDDCDLLEPPR